MPAGSPARYRFRSGDVELAAHLAVPPGSRTAGRPGVVLCHGFPGGTGRTSTAAMTLPELADRIAAELEFAALTFTFRGCGDSPGQFSLNGWMADVEAAVAHLAAQPEVRGVWLAGYGTGGSLAVCVGAADQRVRGVATLGAPADLEEWAGTPRRLLDHARAMGAISDPSFPRVTEAWAREFRDIRPVEAARALAPRPLLVVHGLEDEAVPSLEGRLLADAHGSAELRLVAGAGSGLRHDPRAVALLLGWLDRQRHQRTRRAG